MGSVFLFSMLLNFIFPLTLKKLNDTSTIIYAKGNQWLYVTTNKNQKWRFELTQERLKKIDPSFIKMLLTYEDKNFYAHCGVDVFALFRAFGQLVHNGRIISGASTITMQLARLLYPAKRTLFAKFIQILRAFQLEYHYTKEDILRYYLTLTPYGGNVEGIIAGSMRYFGKLPYRLTASQSALLVSLPQSPEQHRPDKKLKKAIKARDKVLTQLHQKGFMNRFEYLQAKEEKLFSKTYSFPRYAGHLSQKIVHTKPFKNRTTLNFTLQKQLELWAEKQDKILANNTTLALLVIENNSSEIRAYIGSHNQFSSRVSGYIDMTQAIRSPASTLKPFIYALGFEQHIIHPKTTILDEEVRFGDYAPHNFSNGYIGEVSIAYALQYSLNIPAVKVLQKVGVELFMQKLKNYTKKIYIPKNKITLPIALGGLGISMWELAGLYVALANQGSAYPIHYLKEQSLMQKKLLTPKASLLTTAILREVPPPKNFTNMTSQIAYKTGTSYGFRDAWSVGYTRDYTIIVWVGKPNNTPQLHLTGSNTATPLLFELFSMLHALLPQKNWEFNSNNIFDELPKSLHYFDKKKRKRERPLYFLSPSQNSRFRSADCSQSVVEIKIRGGEKPYFWYIDKKLKKIYGNQTNELFDFGGHTIKVIDTKGESITREVWIDKPEC